MIKFVILSVSLILVTAKAWSNEEGGLVDPVIIVVEEESTPTNFSIQPAVVEGVDGESYDAVEVVYKEDLVRETYVIVGKAKRWDEAHQKCQNIRPSFRLVTRNEFFKMQFIGIQSQLGSVPVYDLGPDNRVDGKKVYFFEHAGPFTPYWFSNDSEEGDSFELAGSDLIGVIQGWDERVVSLEKEIATLWRRITKMDKKWPGFENYGPANIEAHHQSVRQLRSGVEAYCVEVVGQEK